MFAHSSQLNRVRAYTSHLSHEVTNQLVHLYTISLVRPHSFTLGRVHSARWQKILAWLGKTRWYK